MAKLTTETKTVVTKTFNLTLTQDEAAYLYALVGNIGGTGALRTVNNDLYDALSDAFDGAYTHIPFKKPLPVAPCPELRDDITPAGLIKASTSF